jgi:predicted HTH transcriptional regulator
MEAIELIELIARGEDSRTQFKQADEVPVQGTTTRDLDPDHFREFFEKQYEEPLARVLERDSISLAQLLHNLGLARDNSLNLAGLMLFGRYPQRHRPAFTVKAVSMESR